MTPRAQLGELRAQLGRAGGGEAAAAEQQQLTRAVPSDQVPGDHRAERAGPPGDQNRAVVPARAGAGVRLDSGQAGDVRLSRADRELRLAAGHRRVQRRHESGSSSMSSRTIRPGCSVCAERTRPHTAACAGRVGARADRAAGDDDQPRVGEPIVGDPVAHQSQHTVYGRMGGVDDTAWRHGYPHHDDGVYGVRRRQVRVGDGNTRHRVADCCPGLPVECRGVRRRDRPLDVEQRLPAVGAGRNCRRVSDSTVATGAPVSSATTRDADSGPLGVICTRSAAAPVAVRVTPDQANGTSVWCSTSAIRAAAGARRRRTARGADNSGQRQDAGRSASATSANSSSPLRQSRRRPRKAGPYARPWSAARPYPPAMSISMAPAGGHGWPGRGGGSLAGGSLAGGLAQHAGRVLVPCLVRVGAGVDVDLAPALVTDGADGELDLCLAPRGQRQRRFEGQLVHPCVADLDGRSHGQLEQYRTRHKDRSARRVVGQPRLLREGQPAGKQHRVAVGDLDRGAEQRVVSGFQASRGHVAAARGGQQPVVLVVEGVGG